MNDWLISNEKRVFRRLRCTYLVKLTVDWYSFVLADWTEHQGDRIRTYGPLYPKQMRWPDCATPRLPPGTYRSTRSINTRTELAHPALGTGTREPPLFWNLPLSFTFIYFFIRLALGYVSFGPKARLEVDSNHWHKDFQSFALTCWATWTTFLKYPFFIYERPTSSGGACSRTESRPGTGRPSFGQVFFAIDATKNKKEALLVTK